MRDRVASSQSKAVSSVSYSSSAAPAASGANNTTGSASNDEHATKMRKLG